MILYSVIIVVPPFMSTRIREVKAACVAPTNPISGDWLGHELPLLEIVIVTIPPSTARWIWILRIEGIDTNDL